MRRLVVSLLFALGFVPALWAEDFMRADTLIEGVVRERAWGITGDTIHTIPDANFNPHNSGVTFGYNSGRYSTGGIPPALVAGVMLPSGASIRSWELEACDSSAAGRVEVVLVSCPSPDQECGILHSLNTGPNAETPGCAFFGAELPVPHTVDNRNNRYFAHFFNPGATDGTVRLRAVRIGYRLQVSEPPATPTFGDVPLSNPIYRYVEALVAAGITAGCGSGNYCPNDPVTRGQMAVFLAKALGLHWPL